MGWGEHRIEGCELIPAEDADIYRPKINLEIWSMIVEELMPFARLGPEHDKCSGCVHSQSHLPDLLKRQIQDLPILDQYNHE
jgi:hypothetical protein